MPELDVARAVANARADNPRLAAICTPRYDEALRDAPRPGPLCGVPYTLKDVWDVEGLPTTRGHAPWAERVPASSGAVHRAFEAAGAVLIGKTNLGDLGITPESQSYVGGVTRNPLDPSRTAGGSSGGAAAAVAAGMSAFDWGSDYGGSIRLPAAWCGLVGLRLSRSTWPSPPEGWLPPLPHIAWLSAMGPITRDLETCRRVLDAVPSLRVAEPPQPRFAGVLVVAPDAFSAGEWPGFAREIRAALDRAGLPSWPAPLPRPAQMDRVFVALIASHAVDLLRGRGPRVGPVLSALTIGRLLGDRRMHPQAARVTLELAALRLLRHRDRAGAMRDALSLRARFEALWAAGFILVSPTSGYPAPPHGRALGLRGMASFAKMGNVSDATALTVPFGHFPGGLPRGLQWLGPPGSERRLIELASRVVRAPVA